MNEAQFRTLLNLDRAAVGRWIGERKIEEWMQDGKAEAARCIGCWIGNKLDLGDDETLVELAQFYFVDEDERRTVYLVGSGDDDRSIVEGAETMIRRTLQRKPESPEQTIVSINHQGIPRLYAGQPAAGWPNMEQLV